MINTKKNKIISEKCPTKNVKLIKLTEEIAKICNPDDIYWCKGTRREFASLCLKLAENKTFIKLNSKKRPNSFLCRSDKQDRGVPLDKMFTCSLKESDAGPTNNWVYEPDMKVQLKELFTGSMKGRTLYIVPFSMAPMGSSFAKVGILFTDSPWNVILKKYMANIGQEVLNALGAYGEFYYVVHSVGQPLENNENDKSWPCNPEKVKSAFLLSDYSLWSFGSGFISGENAINADDDLKLFSAVARKEGKLAENMAVIAVKSPEKPDNPSYMAVSLPGICGKTTICTLEPPPQIKNWEIKAFSNEMVWLKVNEEGYLTAVNPHKAIFGKLKGINENNNKNIIKTIASNTIFLNTAMTSDFDVWWPGLTVQIPDNLIDENGQNININEVNQDDFNNASYISNLAGCPNVSEKFINQEEVIIDAIVFGGKTSNCQPLITEAFNWVNGVYAGTTVSTDEVSVVGDNFSLQKIRNSMAMANHYLFDLSYYLEQWINLGSNLVYKPKIFCVNVFRKDENGNYIWPGFSYNFNMLKWIYKRIYGNAKVVESPLGYVPLYESFIDGGLDISKKEFTKLFCMSKKSLKKEVLEHKNHLRPFADLQKLPREFMHELGLLSLRIERAKDVWEPPA